MPRNLAVRYEHFLRLHALIDILANARQPLDDATLIGDVRERLGLTRLSPRTKLEAAVSDELRDRLGLTRSMFRVETDPSTRLADHPRMLSALATAIVEHRLIDVEHRGDAGMVRSRLEPSWLRIKPPTIELVARARLPDGEIRETSIGVAEITRVTLLDETFAPRPSDPGPASPAG